MKKWLIGAIAFFGLIGLVNQCTSPASTSSRAGSGEVTRDWAPWVAPVPIPSTAVATPGTAATPKTITESLEQGVGWEFVEDPVCLVSKLPQPNPRRGNDREVVMRFHVLNRNSTAISISVVVDTELRYTDGWSDESIISFEGVESAIIKNKPMVFFNKLVVPGGPGIFDVDLRAVVGPQVRGTTSRCLYSWQVIGVSLA